MFRSLLSDVTKSQFYWNHELQKTVRSPCAQERNISINGLFSWGFLKKKGGRQKKDILNTGCEPNAESLSKSKCTPIKEVECILTTNESKLATKTETPSEESDLKIVSGATLCDAYVPEVGHAVYMAKKGAEFKTEKSKESKTATKGEMKKGGGSESKSPPKIEKPPSDPIKIFKVYRYNGILGKGTPKIETYELDMEKCGTMVLDAMIKLKDMDPTLTFRRSCREGICGSCGVNVQGNNCLACIKAIPSAKTISIYPLPHMYVIRDLVVDMTHFFRGYNSIRPYLVKKHTNLGEYQYAQSIRDNAKMVGLYECVLCACCATACPSYWWNGRRFLGPATLLHAYRWVIDSRDDDTLHRLHDLRDDFKVYRCHTIMNCSIDCPKGLNPAYPIGMLKRLISRLDYKKIPDMNTGKFSVPAQKCYR